MIAERWLTLRIVYVANIAVAGCAGALCAFGSDPVAAAVFQHPGPAGPAARVAGSFWIAVAAVSLIGLFRPVAMSPLLLVQLIYKGLWLLIVALPAIMTGGDLPLGLAVFFLLWVVVLPWAIPWSAWGGR